MKRTVITQEFSNEGSRNDVRMRVVNTLSKEKPGTGSGNDASGYIYYVETLSDGKRVYLQRPANLHNGFDFLVCVENTNYADKGCRQRNYPKHDDIAKDLLLKKKENKKEYAKLYLILKRIFDCHDISDEEFKNISFTVGLPVEHIVKVIKWLFIEQDIRYWNYSGRYMTWNIVPSIE